MRFILGVLVGYSMRGKEKPLIIVLAIMAFMVYIVLPTVALFALSMDVHHERRSRPVLTKIPAIKGLNYEDGKTKLHASNLNIRLLATRYDLPLQPGLIIDQVPQPGEEVVYGYPVGVTIAKADSHGHRQQRHDPYPLHLHVSTPPFDRFYMEQSHGFMVDLCRSK